MSVRSFPNRTWSWPASKFGQYPERFSDSDDNFFPCFQCQRRWLDSIVTNHRFAWYRRRPCAFFIFGRDTKFVIITFVETGEKELVFSDHFFGSRQITLITYEAFFDEIFRNFKTTVKRWGFPLKHDRIFCNINGPYFFWSSWWCCKWWVKCKKWQFPKETLTINLQTGSLAVTGKLVSKVGLRPIIFSAETRNM